MTIKRSAVFGLLVTVSLLPACSTPSAMTQAEIRDSLVLPQSYADAQAPGSSASQASWRAFFDDPVLAAYIDEALAKNQELNILLQEIEAERAEVRAATGELLPSARLRASAEGEKVGEFTRAGAVEENLEIKEHEEFPTFLPNYFVGAEISWEVDVWKRLRNGRKAQVYRYLASQEGRNFAVTKLVAEIARTYYELRALDARLERLDQTIELQRSALDTVRYQKDAARATELAVRRFEAEVLGNESERFALRQDVIRTENELRFLLGGHDGPIKRGGTPFPAIPTRIVAIGTPADLLGSRPDIRQAELELQASALDIKSARARFFPSLDIEAAVGLESFETASLTMTPESLVYGMAANLTVPLFNRTAIQAAYRQANARQLRALYDYQQTVLNAYLEVATLAASASNLERGLERKEQQVAAFEASIDVTTGLFSSARAEYTEVLLTQREALEAEIELIELKQQQIGVMIDTYRALGGGAPQPAGDTSPTREG